MTAVQRAIIKQPDGKPQTLTLFRVEPTVFRWIDQAGKPWDGVDFLEAGMAIKSLRMTIESDPSYVGYDLTFYPVELPPEERAAKRVIEEMYRVDDWGPRDIYVPPEDIPRDIGKVSSIIKSETGIDKLVESVNLLLTYEFPRRLQPKRPGLDLTWGGLVLSVLEALEVAQKSDLSNLKAELTKGIEQIQVYSNMPPQGGKPQ